MSDFSLDRKTVEVVEPFEYQEYGFVYKVKVGVQSLPLHVAKQALKDGHAKEIEEKK